MSDLNLDIHTLNIKVGGEKFSISKECAQDTLALHGQHGLDTLIDTVVEQVSLEIRSQLINLSYPRSSPSSTSSSKSESGQ